FQAAPGVPPATTTWRPSSAKNTGSRASGSIRGSFASGSIGVVSVVVIGETILCIELLSHDALDFGQAGAAFGAGAQRLADLGNVRGLSRCDRILNGGETDAEAGTDQLAGLAEA